MTIAPNTRVVLTCKGFEGERATVIDRYRAPGAQPDEWVIERAKSNLTYGGQDPYMAVRERDLTPIED